MNITFEAYNFPNCQCKEGDGDLLFFVSDTVRTADGAIVTKSSYNDCEGNWYKRVPTVIENGLLKVPQFSLPSLSDSNNPYAKWKVIARRKSTQIDFAVREFALNVNTSGTMTWGEILLSNSGYCVDTQYTEGYNKQESDAKYAQSAQIEAIAAELTAIALGGVIDGNIDGAVIDGNVF